MKPLVGGFEVQPLEKKGSYLSEHWLVWLSSSWLSWTRLMVSNEQTCLCFLLGERRWPLSRAVHGTAPMVQEGSSGAWDWWAHGRWREMGGGLDYSGPCKIHTFEAKLCCAGVSLSGRWRYMVCMSGCRTAGANVCSSCTINPRCSSRPPVQTVPLQIQHRVPGHESSSQKRSVW